MISDLALRVKMSDTQPTVKPERWQQVSDEIAEASDFSIDERMAELRIDHHGCIPSAEIMALDAERHWSMFEDACRRIERTEALVKSAIATLRKMHHEVCAGDSASGDDLWDLQETLHKAAGLTVPTQEQIERGGEDISSRELAEFLMNRWLSELIEEAT